MKLRELLMKLDAASPQYLDCPVLVWIDGTFVSDPVIWLNIIMDGRKPNAAGEPHICIGRPLTEQTAAAIAAKEKPT